jgi:hypothetical protein
MGEQKLSSINYPMYQAPNHINVNLSTCIGKKMLRYATNAAVNDDVTVSVTLIVVS